MKLLPFENLSLSNLPGEKWKDIAGYEGYYQVCNMGRVKSLPGEKEVYFPSRNLTIRYLIAERILKQNVFSTPNKQAPGQPFAYCKVTLTLPVKQTRGFIVSRLVYAPLKNQLITKMTNESFVKKMATTPITGSLTFTFPIIVKVSKKTYEDNRRVSHIKNLSRTKRNAYTKAAISANLKPVAQYDMDCRLIKVHESIKADAKAVKLKAVTVSNAAKGRIHTTGGYIWRQETTRKKINTEAVKKAHLNQHAKLKKAVVKFSLKGVLLHKYDSIAEAAAAHGGKSSRQISDVIMAGQKWHMVLHGKKLPVRLCQTSIPCAN